MMGNFPFLQGGSSTHTSSDPHRKADSAETAPRSASLAHDHSRMASHWQNGRKMMDNLGENHHFPSVLRENQGKMVV